MAGRAERETRLAFGHPRIDQMVHPRFGHRGRNPPSAAPRPTHSGRAGGRCHDGAPAGELTDVYSLASASAMYQGEPIGRDGQSQSPLTIATSWELRRACANAGMTATWAMCPRPTTPYRIVRGVAVTCCPPVQNVAGTRRSRNGSDSHASRRSRGQQLTIRSGGIPASRAWAMAVSA